MHLIAAFKAFFSTLFSGPKKVEQKPESKKDRNHLILLQTLQEKGRFVDFFLEDIESFSDAQIGAAVRQVHKECRKELEELFAIRPLLNEKEGDTVTIQEGFDPKEIKLVGNVSGKGPYKGKVAHPGWICKKEALPKALGGLDKKAVLAPAEIEV